MRGLRGTYVLFGLLAAPLAGGETRAPAAIVVIASLGVEAHRSAIEGIQAALAPASVEVRILDVSQASGTTGPGLSATGARVIIALGSEATRVVESEQLKIPTVYAMILRRSPSREPQARAPVTIPLDVSLPDVVARLKELFPGKTRLGIILNPASGGMSAEQLEARGQQLGFTVHVVPCAGAGQLLAAVASLKHQADFVWCLPDGALFNSVTIKPLVLLSLENRLPLIGFSESFARAGAAIGIYADFREVGVEAGETARQVLDGQNARPGDGPRRLKVALNQSVLRLFGLRYAMGSGTAQESLVLP